jgi:hypothetical protein
MEIVETLSSMSSELKASSTILAEYVSKLGDNK